MIRIKTAPALLTALLLCSCAALPAPAPPGARTASPSPAATAPLPQTAPPSQTPVSAPPPTPVPTQEPAPRVTAAPATAPAETATPSPTAGAAKPPVPVSVTMKLPPALYGVVGREMRLYLDNVTLASGPYEAAAEGPGELEGALWRWTPDQPGSYRLSVRAGNRQGGVDLHIAPAGAGNGGTLRCLFIGDSVTGRGAYTAALLKLSGQDGLKLKLLGSRGTAPNRHEGRAGWRAVSYTAYRRYNGIPNGFSNPSGKRFDFRHYMKAMQYKSVDVVCIALGINDVFGYKDDAKLKAGIRKTLNSYDTMIRSIRAYNKNVKIGLFVTIPPTGSDSVFRADYGKKQTLERYRRNNFLFASALIDRYQGREKENIFLVPVHAGFDRAFCYGVHPYGEGYDQIAGTVWAWLKNLD